MSRTRYSTGEVSALDSNEFVWANVGLGVGEALLLAWSAKYVRQFARRVRSRRALRIFRRAAKQTSGVVVDNQMEWVRGRTSVTALPDVVAVTSTSGGVVFRPVVRFTTPDGTEVTFAGHAPNTRQWIVGKAVPVSYHPADPEQAEITGEIKIAHPLWPLLKLVPVALILAYLVAVHVFYLYQGVNE